MVYDVVIVGAGAAGLAAAQELRAQGVTNVLVIDAQNYVGGRIKTWRGWGMPIEIGAEFIHGDHMSTWRYVEELGLPVIRADGAVRLVDKDGHSMSATQKQAFDTIMDSFAQSGAKGISVAEHIAANQDASPIIKQLAEISVGDYEGGDADQLDSGAFADMLRQTKDNGENFIPVGGYQPIVKRLARNLLIRLQTVVKAIDYNHERGVAITLASGEVLYAKRCIVTVSLGVLKSGDINFSPALPSKFQQSVTKLGMGNAMKLILRFRDIELARELFNYADGESAALQTITNWWSSAADPHILVGYCGGGRASAVLAMSPQDLIAKITSDLGAIVGRDIRGDIAAYKIARWDNNPFTKGAYSNHPVGASLDDHAALAEPIGERLFFAGEATALNGNYATVHGAIESGWRAAKAASKNL